MKFLYDTGVVFDTDYGPIGIRFIYLKDKEEIWAESCKLEEYDTEDGWQDDFQIWTPATPYEVQLAYEAFKSMDIHTNSWESLSEDTPEWVREALGE